jgi:hypothetical protein
MAEIDKYSSALRLLGKKVFQLREAAAGELYQGDINDPNAWSFFIKQVLYVTTSLRQVQSGLPADASVLSIVPNDKIWQNPSAVPEMLKILDLPKKTEKCVYKRDNDFFVKMESFSQEAVLNLEIPEIASTPVPEKKSFVSITPLLNQVFKRTSEERVPLRTDPAPPPR